jgi:hypothetical protein
MRSLLSGLVSLRVGLVVVLVVVLVLVVQEYNYVQADVTTVPGSSHHKEQTAKNQRLMSTAISKAMEEVFTAFNYTTSQQFVRAEPPEPFGNICPASVKEHLACCEPADVKYLHNARIAGGKIYLHIDHAADGRPANRKLRMEKLKLPDIVSVHLRAHQKFNMEVIAQTGPFRTSACTSYFDGTLHVSGRVTAHNVYHALGDNLVPLAHQIMLDSILYPDMLHLPRMGLAGFNGHSGPELMSHLQIANDLMSGGVHPLSDLEGQCFRRIVWGYGAHLMYSDSLVFMRRLVTEFLRQYVIVKYPMTLPSRFQHDEDARIKRIEKYDPVTKFNGMNIVLYTRGNSGKGRSMQNEDGLVQALVKEGANVAVCCDFNKASMAEQISYAVHADVVMGVHGAALIHGIFMPKRSIIIELKTLYAFSSSVFHLVADSRSGVVGNLDIREFWKPGGHNPINDWLIGRTVTILQSALKYRSENRDGGTYECFNVPTKGPDPLIECVIGAVGTVRGNSTGPSKVDLLSELVHPLGPLKDHAMDVCHSTVLYQFRDKEFKKPSDEVHCNFCKEYNHAA